MTSLPDVPVKVSPDPVEDEHEPFGVAKLSATVKVTVVG